MKAGRQTEREERREERAERRGWRGGRREERQSFCDFGGWAGRGGRGESPRERLIQAPPTHPPTPRPISAFRSAGAGVSCVKDEHRANVFSSQ